MPIAAGNSWTTSSACGATASSRSRKSAGQMRRTTAADTRPRGTRSRRIPNADLLRFGIGPRTGDTADENLPEPPDEADDQRVCREDVHHQEEQPRIEIGRASCRERVES